MSRGFDVIAQAHEGSLYCLACVDQVRERCTERNEDRCPDLAYEGGHPIFASDEWTDATKRAEQVLQCEECFAVLATLPANMEGVTVTVSNVIKLEAVLRYALGAECRGYRWTTGDESATVWEVDMNGDDLQTERIHFADVPSIDTVEAECQRHFLDHCDWMGV